MVDMSQCAMSEAEQGLKISRSLDESTETLQKTWKDSRKFSFPLHKAYLFSYIRGKLMNEFLSKSVSRHKVNKASHTNFFI